MYHERYRSRIESSTEDQLYQRAALRISFLPLVSADGPGAADPFADEPALSTWQSHDQLVGTRSGSQFYLCIFMFEDAESFAIRCHLCQQWTLIEKRLFYRAPPIKNLRIQTCCRKITIRDNDTSEIFCDKSGWRLQILGKHSHHMSRLPGASPYYEDEIKQVIGIYNAMQRKNLKKLCGNLTKNLYVKG